MGYWDISQMSADADLAARITACGAQERPAGVLNLLLVCAAPGWDAAWASAIAGGNQTPGRDPAVITDGMILSAVQAQPAA
jgi:hypothetical protein